MCICSTCCTLALIKWSLIRGNLEYYEISCFVFLYRSDKPEGSGRYLPVSDTLIKN